MEEVPPPGAALKTVTLAIFTVDRSLAGISAVSVVLLTRVVVRADPFHWTMELLMKFEPLTVSVNAGLLTVVELGEIVVKTGTGLPTVNVIPEEIAPPGLETVTVAMLTVVRSLAGIRAVSFVLLTKVVVLDDPFHWTVEPLTKLNPLTVSVKAGPLTVELGGLKLAIAGHGITGAPPITWATVSTTVPEPARGCSQLRKLVKLAELMEY